ncbi:MULTISPECIES: DUF2625 domain-containing protein [Sphingobacterium]|uniref:DUF2625 domain-containing protein n=1 Tax=Sphingobacterium TaxID=28453 RepID=UPI0025797E72|nr:MULTISPECIES: DUF2625 domain-containing protein [Sphingobacterium]
MKSTIKILLFVMLSHFAFGQAKMRQLNELINKDEDAIKLIMAWRNAAKNKIQILANDSLRSNEALFNTQISTRSPMGAIVFHTGGILIDNGWIRIYGSGSEKLNRNLPDWNKGKTFQNFGDKPGYLIIADDAVGGFFLLNGGDLGNDLGKIYYLSPDNNEYEQLDLTYTEFINFCFSGNIDLFYRDLRWKKWEDDFKELSTNEAFMLYPYLWTKEGRDINKVEKNKASIDEIYTRRIQK